jgi:hypothetical protein
LDGLPVEQLHDDERDSRLVDVVVEHRDGVRVIDRVRGIAFALEANAYFGTPAELRVEHLHRESLPVSVSGRVDDGHFADSEDAVEAIPSAQHRAYSPSRLREQLAVRLQHRFRLVA